MLLRMLLESLSHYSPFSIILAKENCLQMEPTWGQRAVQLGEATAAAAANANTNTTTTTTTTTTTATATATATGY